MVKHFFNNVDELARYMASLKPDEEQGVVEAMNVTFIADSGDCIGTSSEEYRKAELNWFLSQNDNIKGLEIFNGKIPKIWKDIATEEGYVNSNYGYRCLSPYNGDGKNSQFDLAMKQLILNKDSRRGIMVYNFPNIHESSASFRPNEDAWFDDIPEGAEDLEKRREAFKDLKTDFMCCQNSIFSIEGNKLIMSNMMRSLDLRFGLPHDWEWWDWAFDKALSVLKLYYPELERGEMYVSAVSAHVYRRHWSLLEKFREPERSLEEELMAKHLAEKEKKFQKAEEYNEEKDAGEPAYFGSESFNVHGLDPFSNGSVVYLVEETPKQVEGIDITGESRYKASSIEHWDIVARHEWDYFLGCASKYVYRNRFKGQQLADLKKAVTYVEKFLESGKHNTSLCNFLPEEVNGLDSMEYGAIQCIEALSVSRLGSTRDKMVELFKAFIYAKETGDPSGLKELSKEYLLLKEIINKDSKW